MEEREPSRTAAGNGKRSMQEGEEHGGPLENQTQKRLRTHHPGLGHRARETPGFSKHTYTREITAVPGK